jgi:hypothetical protein
MTQRKLSAKTQWGQNMWNSVYRYATLLLFIELHFSPNSISTTEHDAGPTPSTCCWTWLIFGFELIILGGPWKKVLPLLVLCTSFTWLVDETHAFYNHNALKHARITSSILNRSLGIPGDCTFPKRQSKILHA